MSALPRLFIACEQAPTPPFDGNNRRSFDLAQALMDRWEIHLLVYPQDEAHAERVRATWRQVPCQFHFLTRRTQGRYWRSLTRGEALPTVERDFAREAEIIRAHTLDPQSTRLILDSHCVAPLTHYFQKGVVVSGPDCMSRQFGQLARHARSLKERLHNRVRQQFALNNERRWFHRAERVHMVSDMDREAVLRVNPQAKVVVIPLGMALPPAETCAPWSSRRGGLIWGNVDFPPVLTGIQEVFRQLDTYPAGFFKDWSLLGKAPRARALELVPNLERSGIQYLEWCEDVSGLLSRTRFVLCPDLGGAGQKNRCLDALAHGCVVLGLREIFRGFEEFAGTAYLELKQLSELAQRVQSVTDSHGDALGSAARSLFRDRFSHAALGRKWSELLEQLSPLMAGNPFGPSAR